MRDYSQYTNQKFGKLTVLFAFQREDGKKVIRKNTYFHCKCDCGKEVDIPSSSVITGRQRSCGCDSSQNVKDRLLNIYRAMKQRCYYVNGARYKDYGGRGIKICDEWKSSFKNFKTWSLNNGYDDSLTIERIDNDKDYCPENCKWASYQIQSSNQRIRKDNSSGYRGVHFHSGTLKWVSNIQINRKRISLGYYKTAEEAHEARIKYIREHNLTQYGEK